MVSTLVMVCRSTSRRAEGGTRKVKKDAKKLNNGKCNPNHYIPDGSVTKEEAEQALITDQKDGEKADPEQLKHAALWAVYDQNWQWPILDWFAEMALNKQKLIKAIEAIGKAMIKKYEDPPPEVPEEKPEGGYPTPTSNTIPAEDLPKWAPGSSSPGPSLDLDIGSPRTSRVRGTGTTGTKGIRS